MPTQGSRRSGETRAEPCVRAPVPLCVCAPVRLCPCAPYGSPETARTAQSYSGVGQTPSTTIAAESP